MAPSEHKFFHVYLPSVPPLCQVSHTGLLLWRWFQKQAVWLPSSQQSGNTATALNSRRIPKSQGISMVFLILRSKLHHRSKLWQRLCTRIRVDKVCLGFEPAQVRPHQVQVSERNPKYFGPRKKNPTNLLKIVAQPVVGLCAAQDKVKHHLFYEKK